MRYLGSALARAGYTARGLLLPRHGTSIDDLERTLALYLAAQRTDLAAIATLAAPLWLGGLAGWLARWVAGPHGPPIQRIPKFGGSDVRDKHVRRNNYSYKAIPTRALGELLAFMHVVETALPQIAAPVLVLHARRDHTAPVACAARIASLARARRVRILEHRSHLIAVDIERDIVATHLPGDLSCAM